MAPAIPDRWLDYKPIGEVIKGTRIIAFKVPLRDHVVQSVPSHIRLGCGSLLSKIPNLGMIIDLTNTNRYYNPSTFQKDGIVYQKLMIPGHELPPRTFVEKFNILVNNFLQQNANNAKLIGVHCTHGVNRTGYLISSYMISELKISPTDAINDVEKARGHAIERENYRNHLLRLTTSAAAPSRPQSYNSRRPSTTSNHNSRSHRYDNNRSQTSSNNRPIENWRVPQSNSNCIAPLDRSSLPANRHNSSTSVSGSGSRQGSSYERDVRQYSPPRSSYERPVRQCSPPRSSYGKDERQYSPPRSSYDRNVRQYSPPRKSYERPVRQCSPPRSTYSRDERQYSPPRSSYERPVRECSPPRSSYSRDERQYSPPRSSYERPVRECSPPRSSYSRDETQYSPPRSSYERPVRECSPPRSSYSRDERQYSPPRSSYKRPVRECSPPKSSYSRDERQYSPQRSFDARDERRH